ncbi:hypothetical protein MSM1_17555 [Mycobacterium sp. SM1]|uniref:hypothetical protein n=1 Tax=Mycobacterium sp. SM1 TaxID=2816243 RepID=UPI001BCCF31D|nr:hypothetical protein [Mycobacterium sp. SM1]MBS4730066.1 hypothetical protein [Mycobacterium sp. SM1]
MLGTDFTAIEDATLADLPRIRIKQGVPSLRLKAPNGRLVDFPGSGAPLPRWAAWDAAQTRRMLDLGLIEYCDNDGRPTDPERVVECLSAIEALGVPVSAGRPRAAEALRRAGARFSNETIGKAVLLRKSGWKAGQPFPWDREQEASR